MFHCQESGRYTKNKLRVSEWGRNPLSFVLTYGREMIYAEITFQFTGSDRKYVSYLLSRDFVNYCLIIIDSHLLLTFDCMLIIFVKSHKGRASVIVYVLNIVKITRFEAWEEFLTLSMLQITVWSLDHITSFCVSV